MSERQLCESADLSASAPKVDRDAGLVRGVKYLGPQSTNRQADGTRNRYPLAFRRKARTLYESAPVFVDHPPQNTPGAERSWRDRIGTLAPTHEDESGSYGDLRLNRGHPRYDQVMWAAEHDPAQLALSHNARAKGTVHGEWWDAEEPTSVRSVDIVAAGGTTRSLFESAQETPPMLYTAQLAALRAKLDPHRERDTLEMELDPKGMLAILTSTELDDAQKVAQLLAFLAAQAMGSSEEKPDGSEDPAEGPMVEGKRDHATPADGSRELQEALRKIAVLEARDTARETEARVERLVREAGVPMTDTLRKALTALPEADGRALVEELRTTAARRPVASGYGVPQSNGGGFDPARHKSVASFLSGRG